MAPRLMVYRPGWRLTWLGRAASLAVIVLVAALVLRILYPFLAPTEPVLTDTLVVEGWLPDASVASILDAVQRGRYTRVYLTGGTLLKSDPNGSYGTYPDLMKAMLIHRGIQAGLVTAVPAENVIKDRTYASAVALRDWLRARQLSCAGFNLITAGPHARRSRLLFEEAFGRTANIGIIAVAPDDYDPRHWWRSSAGFREVVSEAIAYLYARLWFSPL